MTNESKYLLDTIKSLLHDEPLLDVKASDSSVAIDYEKVFKLAKVSSIACMAACRICDDKSVPEDVRKNFDLERMKITAQQINQGQVVSELKEVFEHNSIKGLLLKGSIIKDLYPNPFMRSMSDIDFFMEMDDLKRVKDLIIECGYFIGSRSITNHNVFKNGKEIKVEILTSIESLTNYYGKEVFSKHFPNANSIQEAMEVWDHTMPFEGSSYMVQLTPEYHYLYVIMHMMRHFISAGTGIRSFIDIWVMNHHYGSWWNRTELNELLNRFGLLKFEQYALALTDRWFSIDNKEWLTVNIDEDALCSMEEYVLDSGTYGITSNHVLKGMGHDTSGLSKLKYLFGVVFRSYDSMKNYYPVLDKAPVLLPVTWGCRFFDLSVKRGKKSRAKLRSVAKADQEQADKLKSLFEKVI